MILNIGTVLLLKLVLMPIQTILGHHLQKQTCQACLSLLSDYCTINNIGHERTELAGIVIEER